METKKVKSALSYSWSYTHNVNPAHFYTVVLLMEMKGFHYGAITCFEPLDTTVRQLWPGLTQSFLNSGLSIIIYIRAIYIMYVLYLRKFIVSAWEQALPWTYNLSIGKCVVLVYHKLVFVTREQRRTEIHEFGFGKTTMIFIQTWFNDRRV